MGLSEIERFASEPSPESFLQNKLELLTQIYSSEDVRKKVLEWLYLQSSSITQKRAFAAIMLGTSNKLFPQKFRNRIGWSVDLLRRKKVDVIIFTGQKDHEDKETLSQAEEAREIAIKEFRVPAKLAYLGGGNNTQENLITTSDVLKKLGLRQAPVFIVSENEHLIRTMTVASEVLRPKGVNAYPNPVGGLKMLDRNDPRVIIELVKAFGYNHVLYRINPSFSQSEVDFIKAKVIEKVTGYERELRPLLMSKIDEPLPIKALSKGKAKRNKGQLNLTI